MKIGLVIYGSLATLSGGYLYDRKLVEQLLAAGDTVEIFALPWRSYPRHLLDNLANPLARPIAAAHLDLLLQDELNHPSLFACNRALRARFNLPFVSIVHHLRSDERHPALLNRLYAWVERRYLRTVDGFIFNSTTTRGRVNSHLPTSPCGIVAYPAADHLCPPPAAEVAANAIHKYVTPRPLQILFVGNVIERKGLHTLLAALAPLPTRAWRLEVVGSLTVAPSYVQHIRRAIAAASLDDHVTLLGAVDDATLKARLTGADLLAVPSFEGFGIVYLEAMAYGLPVIATKAGAAHEIVTPGIDGFLVPPHDAAALSAILARCVQHRPTLLPMSHAARLRYDRHPTWRQSATAIRAWLESLL